MNDPCMNDCGRLAEMTFNVVESHIFLGKWVGPGDQVHLCYPCAKTEVYEPIYTEPTWL